MNDDKTKMYLELIDPLAWFKIIQLLDNNSRLQCRCLSSTSKGYVDYLGLNLVVRNLNVPESPDKKAWRDFIDNPDIYIGKVTIEDTGTGDGPVELGLDQHRVMHLQICRAVSLDWLVNVNWTRSITKLTFHGLGLSASLLRKDRDMNTSTEQDIISLPCLKHLCLYVSGKIKNCRNQRNIFLETRINVNSNASTLMQSIRSEFMETIFVELWKEGSWVEPPGLEAYYAFAQFIQVHSKTLRTVVYNGGRPDRVSAGAHVDFSSIPYGLKHFHVDFIAYCEPNSCWPNMLKQLPNLEEFTNGNSLINNFCRIGPYASRLENNDLTTICQMNHKNLRYVNLKIHMNDYMIDLGSFGTCTQLEYFHLGNMESQASMKNLAMLPASLKVLNIYGFSYPQNGQISNPELHEISLMAKFKNLLELVIYPSVVFKNHGEFHEFARTVLRLRKLVKTRISGIIFHHEESNYQKLQTIDLIRVICEEKERSELNPGIPFQLRLLEKVNPDSAKESEDVFSGITWKEYYHDVHRYRSRAEDISHQMIVNPEPELKSLVLPSVQDIKFRLLQFKK